jgi:ribosomal protein L7/L12
MRTENQRKAHIRDCQIVRLQELHRSISDEWGQAYYSVINAVEAALSAMEEAHAEERERELEA